jgi:hypothetical protein
MLRFLSAITPKTGHVVHVMHTRTNREQVHVRIGVRIEETVLLTETTILEVAVTNHRGKGLCVRLSVSLLLRGPSECNC